MTMERTVAASVSPAVTDRGITDSEAGLEPKRQQAEPADDGG